jgi:hypothetical protein
MSVDDNREDKELFHRGIGFLHRARPLCGLPPGAFERVERKLEGPATRARRRPLLLAAATVCVVLLAGTAYAVVNGGLAHLPIVGPWLAPKAIEPEQVVKPRRSHVPIKPVPAPSVPAGVGAPAAAPIEPLAPPTGNGTTVMASPPAVPTRASANEGVVPTLGAKHPAQGKVALVSPPAAPTGAPGPAAVAPGPAAVAPAPTAGTPGNSILDESRSFAAAIERWHRERNAGGALAALDEHDRRFAGGRLQMESRLLRAEILLSQDREYEGLALLDQVTIAGSPRARELFTVRGELRIKLGRCREGRADLDEVLAKGMADAFARRAAEAIAHCP